jgi:hypothetical protein
VRTSTLCAEPPPWPSACLLLSGPGASASPQSHRDPDLKPDRLTAYVTTDQKQRVSFNVRRPDQLLSIRNISGLPACP